MFKALAAVFSLAVIADAKTASQAEKDEQFFQGMEQGFFLRNDSNGYK